MNCLARDVNEYRMIRMIGIPKEYEIYASIYIFDAYLLIRLYVFAMLATSPATI